MVLVKNLAIVKNFRASLTSEKSKIHGYRCEAWSAALVVVGKTGYNWKRC